MRCHREREAQIHTATVTLDWCVNEILNICKRKNFFEFVLHLGPGHPEYRSIKKDVLPSSKFWMEPSPYFKQTRNSPVNTDAAFSGLCDPAQYLKQGAFPSSVPTNDPD